jgi:hypothetical protein
MDFLVPVAFAIDLLAGSLLVRRGGLNPIRRDGSAYLAGQILVIGCAIAYVLTQSSAQWAMLLALLASVDIIASAIGVSNNPVLGGLAIATTIVAVIVILVGSFASIPVLVIAGLFAATACVLPAPGSRNLATSPR